MRQTTRIRAGAAGMLSLHELQSRMQAAILDGDDDILSLISGNSRTDAATLFGVYRNAYRGRLQEILANDYPLARQFAGHDAFQNWASSFIDAHPSRTQNARWFGAGFPEFIAVLADTTGQRALSELAAIEKALANVFDGADGDVIGLADLVQIPPDDWTRLTFKQHVTSARLALHTNAFDIWMALKEDAEAPPACLLNDRETLIVWRQEQRPVVRPMPYEESMMWTEAAKGVPFGVLCEMLATFDDPEGAPGRAASYLQGWLVSGLLESVAVQPTRQADRQMTAVP